MRNTLLACALIGAAFSTTSALAQTQYNFTNITYPGSASFYVSGINDGGAIAGTIGLTTGTKAFFRSASGTFSLFTVGNGANAKGLNDANTIVGGFLIEGNAMRGYSLSKGKVTIFNPGTAVSLQGINNAGLSVGSQGTEGILDQGGEVTPILFPGAASTTASAINNEGVIAGNYSVKLNAVQTEEFAYLDDNGVFTQFVCALTSHPERDLLRIPGTQWRKCIGDRNQ